jgi:predicted MPP superfamily phosphohydrolase
MKLLWLSDIHLEFLTPGLARAFVAEIATEKPDAVLVTGDISNARGLEYHLCMLAESLPCPVYFELGNHDYYLGSFEQVDALVQKACAQHSNLIHLGHGEIVRLSNESVLVGHRGWADGRAGSGSRSTIRLTDHHLIADLSQLDSQELFARLNQLGDESARYISSIGTEALKTAQTLVIATHVPPFVEAARYENKPSEPNYAPHFVNVAMGHAILELAHRNPDRNFVVLCGHTHHAAIYSPAPNLKIKVAGAQYHAPAIAEILHF